MTEKPLRQGAGPVKVLITGMSVTGKSSILELLQEKGHRAVDTDSDEFSEWAVDGSGQPDWIWRTARMAGLLKTHRHGKLFVAGTRSNQGQFYERFDHIVLLSAPAAVILARVAPRTTNDYGKHPKERTAILAHLAEVEPLLRATATLEIDATLPLARIADQLSQLS